MPPHDSPPGQMRKPRVATFADQIYGRILAQISAGLFPSGSKLPSETRMAADFGVSRPVVRDALARLQRDGLVESRRGSGSFVLSAPPADLSHVTDMNDVARFQRFQEFRLAIEGPAAGLAAARRGEDELRRIAEAHEHFLGEVQAGRFVWEADRALHLAIIEASGNEFFLQSIDGPDMALSDFMRVSLSLTSSRSERRGRLVAREHTNIVDAIRMGDSKAAQISMENHIIQARRRMLDGSLEP
ncbi:FadR/GntR family transcriptional regulator [Tranquillimonas rosea]|uniref:FadR/GntR family transcriptional regulator n=1 Tax=Tranquillimonas rosea TaxID=641238 RepID=UPI003BAAA792